MTFKAKKNLVELLSKKKYVMCFSQAEFDIGKKAISFFLSSSSLLPSNFLYLKRSKSYKNIIRLF